MYDPADDMVPGPDEGLALTLVANEEDTQVHLALVFSLPEMVMPGEPVMISLGEADEILPGLLKQLMTAVSSIQTIKVDMDAHTPSASAAIDRHKKRITSRLN